MEKHKGELESSIIAAFTVTVISCSLLSYLAVWVIGTVFMPQWIRQGSISNFFERLFLSLGHLKGSVSLLVPMQTLETKAVTFYGPSKSIFAVEIF